jgi:hypothetical protein
MRSFIIKNLREAITSSHWDNHRYEERIIKSTFKDLDDYDKNNVYKNIEILKSLEFGDNGDKIGVWLYESPVTIHYPPFREIDKGHLLLVIVNDNIMTTLFWVHKKKGEYDMSITLKKLVEFTKTEFYHPIKKPITIESIRNWYLSKKSNNSPREKYKKINLSNNIKVKYYEDSNSFETLDDEPINVKDIFEYLPNDEIMLTVFSKSNEDEKTELFDLIPQHLDDDVLKLLESIIKNLVI